MATKEALRDHRLHPSQRKYQAARIVGRFVTGRELDATPRTNARWRYPGTQALTPHGHASRWAHYSHDRRASIRLLALLAVVMVAYGLAVNESNTVATIRVIAWGALLCLGWMIAEKSRRWSHYRTYVVRTATTLGEMLGISRHVDPLSWVHVPTDHRTNPDKTVTIDLTEGYHAPVAQQKRLADLAAKLLSMRDPDWGIDFERSRPMLWLRACPTPPQLVTFEQVRELAENTPVGEFFFGLAARMKAFGVSLSGDSPHILASIGSGGGKSQFGKWMALQALRRGARVVIIDIVKRGASHKWAKGVPGVEIYRHPDTAHQALLDLSDLVETRCEANWDEGEVIDNQQVLLIIEESNRTLRKLQTYWANDLGETKTSLAVLAIEGILCVGREAGVNAVTVGQRMSAAASGGGDARENYGVRLGNRFSRQTAKMLFGDVHPLPQNVTDPGRVQVVIGQTATEIQLPKLPDEDRAPLEWAIEGYKAATAGMETQTQRETPRDLREQPSQDTDGNVVHLARAQARDEGLVTIAKASAELGLTPVALRNARAKDPEFPPERGAKGSAKLYQLDELKYWAANRERRSGGAS
jgi:hypothetical protein